MQTSQKHPENEDIKEIDARKNIRGEERRARALPKRLAGGDNEVQQNSSCMVGAV